MSPAGSAPAESVVSLERLRAFCFPAGPDAARSIHAVRFAERGQLRQAPNARWTEFTAETEIHSAASRFRWDARLRGGIAWFAVTDAYADGHGLLTLRVGGVAVRKMSGPAFDKGELQRYLASLALCPPMLLNHPALRWTCAADGLWLRDARDPCGAAVAVEIAPDGAPLAARALRPRLLGNRTVETPWRATAARFRESDGLRVPTRTDVWWQPESGPFLCYWSEIVSFTVVR